MKGTQIHLNNLLHDPGWNFGIKAYDDFVKKVVGYGRNAEGVAHVVIETSLTKKYARINEQLIPQLKKEEYLPEVILAAVHHTKSILSGWTTVSGIMDALEPFNLSKTLVEKYLRYMAEIGILKGVELQAGLENVYV